MSWDVGPAIQLLTAPARMRGRVVELVSGTSLTGQGSGARMPRVFSPPSDRCGREVEEARDRRDGPTWKSLRRLGRRS
jgi:hypothetical protein